MRKKFIDKLLVQEAEEPMVWAAIAQPIQVPAGWKRAEKLADGCVYVHPQLGLASLRGLQDCAGRRWLHFSLVPTAPVSLEVVRDLRRDFFPASAIVALAIAPDSAEALNMWWSVDRDGLPMDDGWVALVREAEGA